MWVVRESGWWGYGADVNLGVGVVGWFPVFSTCTWNALSERAIHHSCEVVGVDKAKQGVWKQAVYKVHLDGAELRVNLGGGDSKQKGCSGNTTAITLQDTNIAFRE